MHKIHAISCTGANLEEDLFNLVANKDYKRIPKYRDLTPEEELKLNESKYNIRNSCIHLDGRGNVCICYAEC